MALLTSWTGSSKHCPAGRNIVTGTAPASLSTGAVRMQCRVRKMRAGGYLWSIVDRVWTGGSERMTRCCDTRLSLQPLLLHSANQPGWLGLAARQYSVIAAVGRQPSLYCIISTRNPRVVGVGVALQPGQTAGRRDSRSRPHSAASPCFMFPVVFCNLQRPASRWVPSRLAGVQGRDRVPFIKSPFVIIRLATVYSPLQPPLMDNSKNAVHISPLLRCAIIIPRLSPRYLWSGRLRRNMREQRN